MRNMRNFKYTKDHEWVSLDGDIATIGITEHAQELLTDIVFVELPAIGKEVDRKDSIAVVESVKSVSDVYSPFSGEVVEVNTNLEEAPELINTSAFGDGWIVKIKIKDNDFSDLLSEDEYQKLINEVE